MECVLKGGLLNSVKLSYSSKMSRTNRTFWGNFAFIFSEYQRFIYAESTDISGP